MVEDRFAKRKNDILSKLDKSFKGDWDRKILGVCEKINDSNDYYSTSSCSGRIVLMIDEDKKQEGLFVKVYHDKISFEELKGDLKKIMRSQARDIDNKQLTESQNGVIDNSRASRVNLSERVNTLRAYPETFSSKMFTRGIKFKMEPCILHVACRDLNCAQKLFDKAKLAGWKKSGIISMKNHVMLELNSTERLEFPIICDGKILVDDRFLKLIVGEANKKLEKSWEKIERFEKSLK